jgi:hypothetical protein
MLHAASAALPFQVGAEPPSPAQETPVALPDTVRTAMARVEVCVEAGAVVHRTMGVPGVGHIGPPYHHLRK